MKPKGSAARTSSGCLTVLATVVVTVLGINVLGYIIAGDNPGYRSAQGAGSFSFQISVVAAPVRGRPRGHAGGRAASAGVQEVVRRVARTWVHCGITSP